LSPGVILASHWFTELSDHNLLGLLNDISAAENQDQCNNGKDGADNYFFSFIASNIFIFL